MDDKHAERVARLRAVIDRLAVALSGELPSALEGQRANLKKKVGDIQRNLGTGDDGTAEIAVRQLLGMLGEHADQVIAAAEECEMSPVKSQVDSPPAEDALVPDGDHDEQGVDEDSLAGTTPDKPTARHGQMSAEFEIAHVDLLALGVGRICTGQPPLDSKGYESLKSSMAEVGQLTPVILVHRDQPGMYSVDPAALEVVDGRHRLRAAVELELPLWAVVWLEDLDPLIDHVLENHFEHRAATTSQRACTAAGMLVLSEEARLKPSRANRPAGPNEGDRDGQDEGRRRSIIARRAGVGGRTVGTALKLLREHPELFARVLAGELTLNRAESGQEHEVKEDDPIEKLIAAIERLRGRLPDVPAILTAYEQLLAAVKTVIDDADVADPDDIGDTPAAASKAS